MADESSALGSALGSEVPASVVTSVCILDLANLQANRVRVNISSLGSGSSVSVGRSDSEKGNLSVTPLKSVK